MPSSNAPESTAFLYTCWLVNSVPSELWGRPVGMPVFWTSNVESFKSPALALLLDRNTARHQQICCALTEPFSGTYGTAGVMFDIRRPAQPLLMRTTSSLTNLSKSSILLRLFGRGNYHSLPVHNAEA